VNTIAPLDVGGVGRIVGHPENFVVQLPLGDVCLDVYKRDCNLTDDGRYVSESGVCETIGGRCRSSKRHEEGRRPFRKPFDRNVDRRERRMRSRPW